MTIKLTPQNPKAIFRLTYNFSKMIIDTFKVPSLEPARLPIIKISVKDEEGVKDYRIDTKNSLDDDMMDPIFEVYTEFPISENLSRSINKNFDGWISLELEKGEWIEVEYSSKGGLKRIQ